MTKNRLFQQSFSGGELSREMQGRIGDTKYRSGCAVMRNMVPKPQGAAARRPGFGFTRETKFSGDRKSCVRGFTFSSTDTTVVEFGHEHFRFYTDNAVVLYATPRTIESIDDVANTITFTGPHDLAVDDAVQFTADSRANGDIPGGLSQALGYFVKTVVDATTITVSATVGGANVNITNDGNGTIRLWLDSEMPPDFEFISHNFLPGVINTSLDTFNIVAHGYDNGQPIRVTTSGVMPAPLISQQRYYVIKISANVFQLALTYELATAAVPTPIDITSPGTVGHLIINRYIPGDLVYHNGSGATPHGVYYNYVEVSAGSVPPDIPDFWHAEPVDGVYEIPSPYQEDDLFDIERDQSFDVLYLAHQNYDLGQLRREAALRWVLTQVSSYGPVLDPPTITSITPTYGSYQFFTAASASGFTLFTVENTTSTTLNGHSFAVGDTVYAELRSGGIGGGVALSGSYPADFYEVCNIDNLGTAAMLALRLKTIEGGVILNGVGDAIIRYASLSSEIDNTYVVTAVTEDGDESEASGEMIETGNNLSTDGSYNTIAWEAISGARRYRVYKKTVGLFVLIGETEELTFKDDNLGNSSPDAGETPPIGDESFDGDDNPAAIGRFEQRRVLCLNQEVWLTATNTQTSLTFHLPVVDTDRINFTLDSNEVCPVRHVVELGNLVLLTSTVEFVVTPVNQDAITPTSRRARAVTYIGASTVKPLLINSTLLFAAARGGHIREFGRTAEGNYSANDVSIRAAHLFDNFTIVDSAMMKSPYPIAWWVSSSGILLGFTYVPEEGIGGWHWHDTEGVIESCCVVTEGTEDVLYLVIKRTIDGVARRYIERMAQFAVGELEDCFHVDSGLTYSGSAATTISGLGHLEGESVQVFANGVVRPTEVVDTAEVVIASTTKAHIGLGYRSELKTLPVVAQIDQAFGQGREKNVNRLWVDVVNSCRFQVGTEDDDLAPATDVPTTGMVSTEVDVAVPGDWNARGQVIISQEDPVPLTVVSLCAEVSFG